MNNILIGIGIGVVGSLIANVIVSVITGMSINARIKRWVVKLNISKRFHGEYLRGFTLKRSSFAKHSMYYYREGDDFPKEGFGAPFALLSERGLDLECFKAFLIPPLDNGHSSPVSVRGELELLTRSLGSGGQWQQYFERLGEKARACRRGGSIAKRIVFIDKFLVNYLLDYFELAVGESGISVDGQLALPLPSSGNAHLSQHAFRTAFHLLSIHRFNRPFSKDVETVYVDKSMVGSNEYYDFGLYEISGLRFVYLPHYLKDRRKTVVGDKLFLGESRRQNQSIAEFEADFDRLWKRCSAEFCKAHRKRGDENWAKLIRVEVSAFSYEDFEEIYYKPLNYEFQNRLMWVPHDC